MPEAVTHAEDTRLLQEIYADDPWKLLVCCILLNQTARSQVNGVLDRGLFLRWPYPASMRNEDRDLLILELTSLGFQNVRARRLIEMSKGWSKVLRSARRTGSRWPSAETVATLPGVGDYAEDSYRFFVLRDFSRFRSGDKELKSWLRHSDVGELIHHICGGDDWEKMIEEGW